MGKNKLIAHFVTTNAVSKCYIRHEEINLWSREVHSRQMRQCNLIILVYEIIIIECVCPGFTSTHVGSHQCCAQCIVTLVNFSTPNHSQPLSSWFCTAIWGSLHKAVEVHWIHVGIVHGGNATGSWLEGELWGLGFILIYIYYSIHANVRFML